MSSKSRPELPPRPTLQTITLTYQAGDRASTHVVPAVQGVAFFWDQKYMLKILGTYYKVYKHQMTVAQAVKGFGPGAEALFKKGKPRRINRKLLKELWNLLKPQTSSEVPSHQDDPGAPQPKALLMAPEESLSVGILKIPDCSIQGVP